MSLIGKVDSLWRYPIKSMRGQEMEEMFAGYAGVYGDRLFAFVSDGSPKGFPYFTGRIQRHMIRYRPRFRDPTKAAAPSNQREAEENGAWSLPASAMQLAIEIEAPDRKSFEIDDPLLIDSLRDGIEHSHSVTLLRSDRAMTDCAPLSLFSLQTVRQLEEESGVSIDKRQFRA
ncbi:MAG TPA: MOSC N-terminal beta barrel domain-containing protein, partial [Chthoniobacterales bacterium]|nr:MOSC N-terminal beta barrel domain-containing protein [Chthoniobacterales bacterium]